MINMSSVSSSQGGKLSNYYAQDDYYFQKQDGPDLHGTGVKDIDDRLEKMGLDSTQKEGLTKDQFLALANGDNRQVMAKDLTISAPKSVSIVHGLGDKKQREDMFNAHNNAVNSTLDQIEKKGLFQARMKEDGKVKSEAATGMIAAKFHHGISRNEDPQLHTHALIMNSAIAQDGREMSVNYREIFRNQKYLDDIYKTEMRRELETMGYKTERTENGFELSGVSREQIEAFSSRLEEVNRNLEEQGKSRDTASAKERENAALNTRKSKSEHGTQEERLQSWKDTAQATGIDVENVRRAERNERTKFGEMDKEKLLQEGFKESTENNADFTQTQLHREMLQYADSKDMPLTSSEVDRFMNRADIKEQFVSMPGQDPQELSPTREKLTTKAMLQAEYENRTMMKEGRGAFEGKTDPQAAQKVDAAAAREFDFKFEGEQRAAAIGILESKDAITCVQGDPGTGKTTMLKAAVQAHGEKDVIGLSKAGVAAKKLGDETGIEARTIDRMLIDYDRRQEAREKEGAQAAQTMKDTEYLSALENGRGLVVVDEASMVGSMDMNRLSTVCHDNGAKLVLVGDQQQLPGVGAGTPFQDAQQLGVETHRLSEIRRQQTDRERSAVEAITKRQDAAEAVQILEGGNVVKEQPDAQKRHDAVVSEFMQRREQDGKDPLLITSLNKDRDQFNDSIRDHLKERGEIKDGQKFSVETPRGKAREREFSVGDRVVLMENDKRGRVDTKDERGVLNGMEGRIDKIEGKNISLSLEDGRKANIDTEQYKKFDHAYALSTYKSQGQSVNQHVIYHAPQSSPLLSKNEFLVGISRNKNGVSVHTDDKQKMTEKAQQWAEKKSALGEYAKGHQKAQGSPYRDAVKSALDERKVVAEKIRAGRQDLKEQHGGKWDKVPQDKRAKLNEVQNRNRDRFDSRLAEAGRLPKNSALDQEAYKRVQEYQKESRQAEQKRGPKVNEYRAKEKAASSLDKDFRSQYSADQGKELDRQKAQAWKPEKKEFYGQQWNQNHNPMRQQQQPQQAPAQAPAQAQSAPKQSQAPAQGKAQGAGGGGGQGQGQGAGGGGGGGGGGAQAVKEFCSPKVAQEPKQQGPRIDHTGRARTNAEKAMDKASAESKQREAQKAQSQGRSRGR